MSEITLRHLDCDGAGCKKTYRVKGRPSSPSLRKLATASGWVCQPRRRRSHVHYCPKCARLTHDQRQLDPDHCDSILWEHGDTFEVTAMGKIAAAAHLGVLRLANPDLRIDWHYVGGRAVYRSLTRERYAELSARGAG